MLIYPSVESLLYYAQAHLLLDDLDVIWARNLLLDELKLHDYVQYEVDYDAIEALDRPDTVLEPLVSYAVDNGIITDDKREYFAGKLMNIVCKRPAEITDIFNDLHRKSAVKAFDWLYDYGIKSDCAIAPVGDIVPANPEYDPDNKYNEFKIPIIAGDNDSLKRTLVSVIPA